jgi:CheY-like chemotaxis protein
VQNDQLSEAIAKRPTKQTLKQLARATGMQTMLEDGIEKIRQGLTTIEEVVRVCPIDQNELRNTIQFPEFGKTITDTEHVCSFCQECGAVLEEDWTVCPFCGTRISDSVEMFPQNLPKAQAPAPIQSTIDKQSIRILAADDEAPVREIVQLLLKQEGYQVIPAVDGEDALEKIRAELPDLVILDINMPKRNGFSVCKAVRSTVETMFIPVIMLTGQDSVEEKLEGLSSGADDYITKPFNSEELLARIETVLRRSYQQKIGEDDA